MQQECVSYIYLYSLHTWLAGDRRRDLWPSEGLICLVECQLQLEVVNL